MNRRRSMRETMKKKRATGSRLANMMKRRSIQAKWRREAEAKAKKAANEVL